MKRGIISSEIADSGSAPAEWAVFSSSGNFFSLLHHSQTYKNPSGKVAHVTCMLHASYMRRVLCMLP